MDPHETASDRRALWLAALLLMFVAGFYLVRGMPWAHIDDLVFTGAGIDLARTGQLTNHTMDGWLAGLQTDKFYVQLPFSVYSLAAWIHLFGANTVSFIAFQWLCYVLAGIGLVRTLGNFGVPHGVRFLVIVVYLTLVIQAGFRPEAEAFGLMFLGLGFLRLRSPFWLKLTSLLLLGFSMMTYPMTLAFAAPFSAATLWLQRPAGQTISEWLRELSRTWLVPVALSVIAVVVSFLVMIHFDLAAFLNVFNTHRRTRQFSEGSVLGFFRMITEYREAALTLPVLMLLVAALVLVFARWRSIEPRLRVLVCACATAAVGCVVLYSARAGVWGMVLAFCAACSLACAESFRRYRWIAVALVSVLYLWSQSLWIVNATFRRFPDPAVFQAARDAALTSGKVLYVNSSTARYVFDYQLPEHTQYLVFSKPFRGEEGLTMADKKQDAYWIATILDLEFLVPDLPAQCHDYPRITIAGHEFKSLPLRPDQPVVLP